MQRIGHRHHRGDADATTDQDRAACVGGQGEQVARHADLDFLTFEQLLVHGDRTTARSRVFQHAQAIDRGLRRVTAQRVLANQPWLQVNVHVCPGLKGRQWRACGITQVEDHDAVALFLALAHHDFQNLIAHIGSSRIFNELMLIRLLTNRRRTP
ncbi:hypothetical protein D3C86_1789600 [compost metagenome]